MPKMERSGESRGNFHFRWLCAGDNFNFGLHSFRVSQFLYAGVFGNEAVSYQAGAASAGSVLKSDYTDFKVGATPVPKLGKSVIIDVKNQELHLFEKGELVKSFSLLAIPESGSAWETSGGGFSVINKAENPLSPTTGLELPNNVKFFVNSFFMVSRCL